MPEHLASAERFLTEGVNPLLKLFQCEILNEERSHAEFDYFLEKYWSDVLSWRKI